MSWYHNLGKKCRDLLVSGLAFLSVGLGSPARADNFSHTLKYERPNVESSKNERELKLDFKSPDKDSEANSNLWYSLNEVFGKIGDVLGRKAGLDNTLPGRALVGVFESYTSLLNSLTSHELGHRIIGSKYGPFKTSYSFKTFPGTSKNFDNEFHFNPTLEQSIRVSAAGLNQNELNARTMFEKTNHLLRFDEGLGFFISKLYDEQYILTNLGGGDDIRAYLSEVNKVNGSNIPKRSLLEENLIADLLTYRTWESLFSVGKYLVNGGRSIKPFSFDFHGNKITPPLINHYMTTKGGFFNLLLPIQTKNGVKIKPEFGLGSSLVGFPGKEDRIRAGMEIEKELNLGGVKLIASPHGYIDNRGGYSLGGDLESPISHKALLYLRVDYVDRDVIEEDINRRRNGINVTGGLTLKF